MGQRERTFRNILGNAMRMFRERGFKATGIADVMQAADLTVGGFYAHFDSKEDLFKSAFLQMSALTEKYVESIRSITGKGRLFNFIEKYLNVKHRDTPGMGCPFALLAGDMSRSSLELRREFAQELQKAVEHRRKFFSDESSPLSEDEAYALMAVLVGGILLSQATRGTEVSDQVLRATRDHTISAFLNGRSLRQVISEGTPNLNGGPQKPVPTFT